MKVIIHVYLVPEVKNVVPEKKPRQRKQQSVTSNPTADLKLLPLISDLPILPSVSNVGETNITQVKITILLVSYLI
jgi:hypothetical protein